MTETVSQSRRSRRFSFTSRRPQSCIAVEEGKSQPPVTTIGFPIDALPLPTDSERPSSSWRNAFRRTQSVDRSSSRAPSSDRRNSRRLVKKQPGNQLRRDHSVSSVAPTLPNVSLIPDTSANVRGRQESLSNNNVDQQASDRNPKPLQLHDRTTSISAQGTGYAQHGNPPTPTTPTLRRVGSPFYHTASEKPAIDVKLEPESPSTFNFQQWRDETMLPASLRVGHSKITVDPGSHHSLPRFYSSLKAQGQHPAYQGGNGVRYDSISSRMQKNDTPTKTPSSFEENTYIQSLDVIEKTDSQDDRVRSTPQSPSQEKQTTSEWTSSNSSEVVLPPRPLSPRPKHTKNPSSSSTATSSSSSSSKSADSSTSISSNPSVTHLEPTASNNSIDNSKKEIPRNTLSPKHDKYLTKIFVVCCHCNHWHDIPSGMYAKMIIPECLLFSGLPDPSTSRSSRSSSKARESSSTRSISTAEPKRHSVISQSSSSSGGSSPLSSPKTTVKCSWCRHEMEKSCCASWTTMVHMIERHH